MGFADASRGITGVRGVSTVNTGNLSSINLAGSLAGALRNNSTEGESKAAAADRKFQLDQKAMSARSLGDIAEADRSADRDADGRQAYQRPDRPGAVEEQDSGETQRNAPPAPDAFGERGSRLDLEA
jgi:hypothetical protein